jgi:ribokinase
MSEAASSPRVIVSVGDIMLDVVVRPAEVLRTDQDIEAKIVLGAGGQAANVATWAASLGAEVTLIGPQGGVAGELIARHLVAAGVHYLGVGGGEVGVVVSLIEGQHRTMASSAGQQEWLARVRPELFPPTVDWLHVSGYPIWRATVEQFDVVSDWIAVSEGAVSFDVSEIGLMARLGADEVGRRLSVLKPDLLFANEREWAWLLDHGVDFWATSGELVIKHGAAGIDVWQQGLRSRFVVPEPLRLMGDTTGAGDALAAGYLVGGPELALQTASLCVGQMGAQPS